MSPRLPDEPARYLREHEVQTFHQDGAILVRGLFGDPWRTRIDAAVERLRHRPTALAAATALLGEAFAGDAFMWKLDDDFRDFLFFSPASRIAHQLFRSRAVNAFYDQIFVKQPGTSPDTPFHEDVSSWPIRGTQVCSLWMALDEVSPTTGALRVVRGSHHHDRPFAPVTPSLGDAADHEVFDALPDIDEDQVLSWDMEPGDVVIFHPKALHGASYRGATQTRRAYVSRWLGDGVTFEPRHAALPLLWEHGLAPGDPMGGPLFPRILPHTVDAECERRWLGPEPPDPDAAERFMTVLRHR